VPIFEYKCKDCGFSWERITYYEPPKDVPCDHCLSYNTERMISKPGYRRDHTVNT